VVPRDPNPNPNPATTLEKIPLEEFAKPYTLERRRTLI